MNIEVSNGEIVDKLTIIEIKLLYIEDNNKRLNLKTELLVLNRAATKIISKEHAFYKELYTINLSLWKIEDRIRALEKQKEFGKEFIEIARSVYFTNDKRSEVKRKINELTKSTLTEEKSYNDYS